MSLINRIDALPIRAKVLCGSFAYGYTEVPEEPGDPRALRVGADVYRYSPPSWYLDVWEPWAHGTDEPNPYIEYINGVRGIWEHVGVYERMKEYEEDFAEYVGDKVWRGGPHNYVYYIPHACMQFTP